MLIILPIAAFVLTFLALLGVEAQSPHEPARRRRVVLQAALLLGGYMVLGSELLSLFGALNTAWVSLLWALPSAALLMLGVSKGWFAIGVGALRAGWRRPVGFEISAGVILGIVLVLLLLVALRSPTNNNDSLRYHMARVVHWAQSASLAHYPTIYAPQVIYPIQAELTILHGRLLWGSDQLANMVQWLSLLGSLVAVSGVTALFMGQRSAQWLSVAFVISLPLALLEGTSTQNDLVAAFYLACLFFFLFRLSIDGPRRSDPLWLGLALGLGLLTKLSFYAYALIPLLYLIYLVLQGRRIGKALFFLLGVGAIVVILNLGFWARNLVSFGSPIGSSEFVASHVGTSYGPGAWVGSIARGVAQNLVTPSEAVNDALVGALKGSLSPIDPQMQGFSIEWGWNHEDLAGNPIHLLLLLFAVSLLLVFRRRLGETRVFVYLGIALASYALLSISTRFDFFGIRYQLPFWVAAAPLFGIAIQTLQREPLAKTLTILLLLSAFPWALFNRTRPLIAMRPSNDPLTIPCLAGCTVGSILTEPPEKTLFAVWGERGSDYVAAMDLLKTTACTEIGLIIDSSDLEYAYWWLLDAPQSGRRLESLRPMPELRRYLDPDFRPCAIICTECPPDQSKLDGAQLAGEFGHIKIYLSPDYRTKE
jgi:hypothetical protein